MPVNNSTNRLPLPVARSTSEVDLASASRTGAVQQDSSQGSETPRVGVSRPGLRRQRSLQELQLRQAINQQHAARGEQQEGLTQPSISSQSREEFQAHAAADRLRSRGGSTDAATQDGLESDHETQESVASLDTLSVSSTELADFLGDVFDPAPEESDARSTSSSVSTSSSQSEMGPPREELLANWNSWASSPTSTDERRSEAVRRLIDCFDTGNPSLDLAGLSLTCLPEHLPTSVTHLYLSHNFLTSLPRGLPADLEDLDVADNRLTSLPDDLPENLESLDASENDIDHLPDTLPAGLQELHASHNRLTSLPATLPAGLLELVVFRNSLTSLPENLPRGLESLRVNHNQLTSLPENILDQLSQDCEIDVDSNPLTQRVIDRLNELTNSPDYQGPSITFSMDDASARPPARPLPDAVAEWPGVDPQAARQAWNEFAGEEGAAEFSQFLDYLKDTVNFQNPAFQQNVAQWLTHLQERPELRRDTFLISQGASASCEDRVSLTFNAMKHARLASDVQRGDYDNRLPELITLGRGMFRLDQLESIAREKVRTLNFVDEIEVYLAYQVKLREPLALPLDTPDMRYFNVSYVTQDDLANAQERVRTAERDGFSGYLACDWQPWQAVMQRIDPKGHDRTQEALIDAMGDEFSSRLQARLEQEGLRGNPDAERELGAQVKTEISREIQGRRTHDFLQDRGLLELLQPR